MSAKQFIDIHYSGKYRYGYLCTPARENGKKVNNPIYLVRVINEAEGRFRNKEGENTSSRWKTAFRKPHPTRRHR
jgi:hypothetical protein